jgi:hypothetical protein
MSVFRSRSFASESSRPWSPLAKAAERRRDLASVVVIRGPSLRGSEREPREGTGGERKCADTQRTRNGHVTDTQLTVRDCPTTVRGHIERTSPMGARTALSDVDAKRRKTQSKQTA